MTPRYNPTTDAWVSAYPVLTTLAELGHEIHRIADRTGPGKWSWYGDLASSNRERKIYRAMRDEQQTLIQLTHYEAQGRAVIYAHISRAIDPVGAYALSQRWLNGTRNVVANDDIAARVTHGASRGRLR